MSESLLATNGIGFRRKFCLGGRKSVVGLSECSSFGKLSRGLVGEEIGWQPASGSDHYLYGPTFAKSRPEPGLFSFYL